MDLALDPNQQCLMSVLVAVEDGQFKPDLWAEELNEIPADSDEGTVEEPEMAAEIKVASPHEETIVPEIDADATRERSKVVERDGKDGRPGNAYETTEEDAAPIDEDFQDAVSVHWLAAEMNDLSRVFLDLDVETPVPVALASEQDEQLSRHLPDVGGQHSWGERSAHYYYNLTVDKGAPKVDVFSVVKLNLVIFLNSIAR